MNELFGQRWGRGGVSPYPEGACWGGSKVGRAVSACPRRRPHLELLKRRRGGREALGKGETPPSFLGRWGWRDTSQAAGILCPQASSGVWALALAHLFCSSCSVTLAFLPLNSPSGCRTLGKPLAVLYLSFTQLLKGPLFWEALLNSLEEREQIVSTQVT